MNDTLKTLSISFCSSLCTALLVVACTASADKPDDDDETEWGSGSEDEWGPGGGTGGDAGPEGVTSAELSDCVLREIASWETDADEVLYADGEYWAVAAPWCAIRVAYHFCGETVPLLGACIDDMPPATSD